MLPTPKMEQQLELEKSKDALAFEQKALDEALDRLEETRSRKRGAIGCSKVYDAYTNRSFSFERSI